MENKFLSIIMPVYNEEGIIEKTIRDYHKEVLSKFSKWEFIAVNDCSKDSTLYILKTLQKEIPITIIDNAHNMGHGPSLIRAYKLAAGEYIFHTDSDYQFHPRDFWKLYSEIGNYDLVVGCRENRQDPTYRRILSQTLKISLFGFFGVNIRDVNSPFRLMKNHFLKIFSTITPDNFMVPSVSMSIFANRKGFKVKEVVVEHLPRKTGKISIMRFKLITFCYKALIQLLTIRKVIT